MLTPKREAFCRLCGAKIVHVEVSVGGCCPVLLLKCSAGHWQSPTPPHTSSLTAGSQGVRVGP